MRKIIPLLRGRIPRLVFCALVAGMFSNYLAKQIRNYNEEGVALMQQLYEMESLLSTGKMWDSRFNWISRGLPEFDSHHEATKSLLQSLQNSLEDRNLQYTTARLPENPATGNSVTGFEKATASLTIKGNERDMVEWLYDLQQPGNFTGIDRLTVEPDESGILCAVQVTRWYLETNSSLHAGQHHEPEIHHRGTDLANRF